MIDSQARMSDSINMFEFENDHSQYMSLGGINIPVDLEIRAKHALAELEAVHQEFKRLSEEYENAVEEREDKFEEAFNHYEDTKDSWIRVVDEHGNVEWVHMSLVEELLPEWLNDYLPHDTLSWGEV